MGVDTALKYANLYVKQAFYSPPVLHFNINPFQLVFIFRLIFFFLNNCLAFRHLPDQVLSGDHQSHTIKPNCLLRQTTRPTIFPRQSARPDRHLRLTGYQWASTFQSASSQDSNGHLVIQVRCTPYGLGQGRLIYKALDEPCKAYYPHTFGYRSPWTSFSALINCS